MAKSVQPAKNAPSTPGTRNAVLVVATCLAYVIAFFVAVPERTKYLLAMFRPEDVVAIWTTGGLGILDRLPAWLITALYIVSAYSVGSLTLRALRAQYETRWERVVFAASLGLGIWSTLTLLIGLLGGLTLSLLFWMVVATSCASEGWLLVRNWKRRAVRREVEDATWVSRLAWLAFVGFVVIYALAGVMPPTDFDVREYHLQVPKEWIANGRIEFMPHNIYGNMPLGAEMHVLAIMSLTRDFVSPWYAALAGKTVIAMFAPLTALAIYVAGRRWFSPTSGAIAAAVYLSFPWIAHVSFNGLIDAVLAHYVFVATYAAMTANGFQRKLFVTGMLAGAAAACKYPGLVFALPPVIAILVWPRMRSLLCCVPIETRNVSEGRTPILSLTLRVSKEGSSPVINQCRPLGVIQVIAITLCGFALIVAPWYAKNAVFTGNPVYPLAARWFGGATRTPEKIAQWERAHQAWREDTVEAFDPRLFAQAAWKVGLTSEWLSPIAWPLAALGIMVAWRRRETWQLLAAAAWIFAVWWFATHRIDRFWLPCVPLLAVLCGAIVNDQVGLSRRITSAVATIGVALSLLLVVVPLVRENDSLHVISNPFWLTPLEVLKRDQCIPAHQVLNDHCPANEAVLLVGDAEPFDLQMPVLYNTCFDDSIFEQLTKDRPASEVLADLRQQKIRFVLVDWREIARYRSPGNYGLTDYVQPAVFERLVSEKVLDPPKWQSNDDEPVWQIYEVLGEPEASAPGVPANEKLRVLTHPGSREE